MPSILITGANRGLGLEFARQYARDDWRVFATCRKPEQATALSDLCAAHANLSIHRLEVGSPSSVAALASELSGESIDVLLNNAGIFGPSRQTFGLADYESWAEVMRVNAFGAMQMCAAFVEQVARSEKKLMIAISSSLASIGDSDGNYHTYRASKAALNMVMRNVALDLRDRGITAFVINPGWIKSDMGTDQAPVGPEQGIAKLRKIFAGVSLADSGKFLSHDGGTFDW